MKLKTLIGCGWLLMAALGLPAVAEPSPDTVLWERGDVVITAEDLDRFIIETVPAQQKALALGKKGFTERALDNIFLVRFLAAQADELLTDEERAQLDWVVQLRQDRLLAEAVMAATARNKADKSVWEQRAKELYLAEPERFVPEEQVRVSHILIKPEGRTADEAQALAERLRAKVLQGENINELAKQYSDDGSVSDNGGDLGFFAKGKMVPEFEQAAFALKSPSDVSEVVKTKFGYHVIQLKAREGGKVKPFDKVKEQAINIVKARQAAQIREALVVQARSLDDINKHEDNVEAYENSLLKEYVNPLNNRD
jgi:peptidyl-prolyl cis-trans isomerase C